MALSILWMAAFWVQPGMICYKDKDSGKHSLNLVDWAVPRTIEV